MRSSYFTYFCKRFRGMKEQLVDTLYDVQMAAADKTSKNWKYYCDGR